MCVSGVVYLILSLQSEGDQLIDLIILSVHGLGCVEAPC